MVAGGWYESAPNQIAAYRQAVEADRAGALATLVARTAKRLHHRGINSRPVRRGACRSSPDRTPALQDVVRRAVLGAGGLDGHAARADQVKQSWEKLTPLMTWFADPFRPPAVSRPQGS